MYPVLLRLGPITIYSYGVMMALGFLAANWVLDKGLRRQGRDPNLSSTLMLWAAVGGLLGARLLFLLEQWHAFLADPWPLLFTGAGFTWYGGFIGGFGAVTWYIRRHGLSWVEVMDAGAPAIALGHAIGRIGCHLAGDGDWGPPTTLPWGVAYTRAIVGWDFPPGVRVHPTPLYEMIAYLQRKLGIGAGEVTPDGRFSLVLVECLGACGYAPMFQVNDDYHEHLTQEKVDALLESMP